jgi:hypothetical protein
MRMAAALGDGWPIENLKMSVSTERVFAALQSV